MSSYFEDNRSGDGHGRRALRSGAATLIARSANALIQIGSVLCLARLLSPEDYGLVGMVTAITGFAALLVDLGSRDAIVQRQQITEPEVSALFWLTQAIGLLLTVIIAASGPLIARFYGEPRLAVIAIVASLSFVTAALTAQHYALMRRAMMFREIGIIEVVANLIAAAVAIGIALAGLRYWALVVRPIVAALLVAVGVWLHCRWMPRRAAITPGVKSMIRFGLNVTGFTTADVVSKSSDRIAIGYSLGAISLGYYQNALFVYENLIDVLIAPLHNVAVAALSKIRDDPGRFRASWEKALSALAFFAMPLFGLLSVTSRELIVLLLGAKWAASGSLLSVLALRGIPHTVERTNGWLHVPAARTDRWFKWGVFLAIAHGAALLCGLPFGAIGVVTAYVVVMFLLFIPGLAYAGRPMHIGAADVVRVVWRPLVGSIASIGVVMIAARPLLEGTPPLARVIAIGTIYLLSYGVIVVAALRLRAPLEAAASLCMEIAPARFKNAPRTAPVIDANITSTYEGSDAPRHQAC